MGKVPPPLQALQQSNSAGCTFPTAVYSTPRAFQIIQIDTYFGALGTSEIPGNGSPWFLWPGNAFASQTMAIVEKLLHFENKPASSSASALRRSQHYHTKNMFSPSSLSVEKKANPLPHAQARPE